MHVLARPGAKGRPHRDQNDPGLAFKETVSPLGTDSVEEVQAATGGTQRGVSHPGVGGREVVRAASQEEACWESGCVALLAPWVRRLALTRPTTRSPLGLSSQEASFPRATGLQRTRVPGELSAKCPRDTGPSSPAGSLALKSL